LETELLEDAIDPEIGDESEEKRIQFIPKSRDIWKVLAAGRSHRAKTGTRVPSIAAKTRQLPRFHSSFVGPRVDFRRAASSRLSDASYAYNYCNFGPESKLESCRLGFSSL